MFQDYASNPSEVDHCEINTTIMEHPRWRTAEPVVMYHGGPFQYNPNRLLSTSFDPSIALIYSKTPLQLNKLLVPRKTPFYAFSDETQQFTEEEVLLPLCLFFTLINVEVVDFPYFKPLQDYTSDGKNTFAVLPAYTLKSVIVATWALNTRPRPRKSKDSKETAQKTA
jgi:hypothetical protein